MKQKTHSGAKKRVKITGSGKLRMQKAAHNHRLNPKNKRQKNLGGSTLSVSSADMKRMKKVMI